MPTTWNFIYIRDDFSDPGTIPSGARTISQSPAGQTLNGAQVNIQQILIEDELTSKDITHLMQPLPKNIHSAAGLSSSTAGVLAGECAIFFTNADDTVNETCRPRGMFAT